MKKETKIWIEKAKSDIDTAIYNFKGGKYEYAAFLCHQSVEKALKALMIERTGELKKVHDLVYLGKNLNLPDNLIDFCKKITPIYIYSRYPDEIPVENFKDISAEFIKYSEEILEWIEKQL